MRDDLPARLYRFSKTEIALEALARNEQGEFFWSKTAEPHVFHEALELAAAHQAHGGSIVPLEKPHPKKETITPRHRLPRRVRPFVSDQPRDWLTQWQLDHEQ